MVVHAIGSLFGMIRPRLVRSLALAGLAAVGLTTATGTASAQYQQSWYSGSSTSTGWSYGGGPNGIYFNSYGAANRYGGGAVTTPYGTSYSGYNQGMSAFQGGAYGPNGFNQYGGQNNWSNQWGGLSFPR